MSLSEYENLARDHWKEFLPKRFKALKKVGELEAAVTRAAELTGLEITAAMDSGVPRDQAWEEIGGHYILPEPETQEDEDEDDNLNLALWQLSRAIHQETQLLLEGKIDVAVQVSKLNNEERYEEATRLYNQSAD